VEQGPVGGQTGIGTGISNWLVAMETEQGPVGGHTGIGTGISNWPANVEPADSITPTNTTKRKMLFTRNLLLNFIRESVSNRAAAIPNKQRDLMHVPNLQQKIPKMGIRVF
jgi:hypothetical protein